MASSKITTLFLMFALMKCVDSGTAAGCGRTDFYGKSGVITSPNLPSNYSDEIQCFYHIHPISSVSVKILSFDLNPNSPDFLQIQCLDNSTSRNLKYKWNTIPKGLSFRLCTRVRLTFFTNDSSFRSRFSLQYEVVSLVPNGTITDMPINTVALLGDQISLGCKSSITEYFPSWTFSQDGTDENVSVIASFCRVNPAYSSKYTVVKGVPGQCNLTISNAAFSHAGVYTCTDVSLASFSSLVAVIETHTNETKPQEIVKGDELIFQTSIVWHGPRSPAPVLSMHFHWTPAVPFLSSNSTVVPDGFLSSITVRANNEIVPSNSFLLYTSAPFHQENYATNKPSFVFTHSTTAFEVLYWPEADNMTITGPIDEYIDFPQVLTCHVQSNPPATFHWFDEANSTYVNGSSITADHNGTYTCIAYNIIRGTKYEASKSIIVQQRPSNNPKDSSDNKWESDSMVQHTDNTGSGYLFFLVGAAVLGASFMFNVVLASHLIQDRMRSASTSPTVIKCVGNRKLNDYVTSESSNTPEMEPSAESSSTTIQMNNEYVRDKDSTPSGTLVSHL